MYLRLPGLLASGVRDTLAHGTGVVTVLTLRIHVPWLVHADLCSLRLPRQHPARSTERIRLPWWSKSMPVGLGYTISLLLSSMVHPQKRWCQDRHEWHRRPQHST